MDQETLAKIEGVVRKVLEEEREARRTRIRAIADRVVGTAIGASVLYVLQKVGAPIVDVALAWWRTR